MALSQFIASFLDRMIWILARADIVRWKLSTSSFTDDVPSVIGAVLVLSGVFNEYGLTQILDTLSRERNLLK